MNTTLLIVVPLLVALWCAVIVTVGVGYLLHKAASGMAPRKPGPWAGDRAQVDRVPGTEGDISIPESIRKTADDPFDPGPVPISLAGNASERLEAASEALGKGRASTSTSEATQRHGGRFGGFDTSCLFCEKTREFAKKNAHRLLRPFRGT